MVNYFFLLTYSISYLLWCHHQDFKMLQGVLTAAGQIRQGIKRFVSLFMQYKGLVKNINLV